MIDWKYLHDKLIETKQVKRKGDNIQEHHIIPRHDNGNNKKNNLVLLPYRYHTLIHYIRWRWLGQIGDWFSFRMMLNIKVHPSQDPEFRKFMSKWQLERISKLTEEERRNLTAVMNTPDCQEKAKATFKESLKDPDFKNKLYQSRLNYIESMEDKSIISFHLNNNPETVKKAKENRKQWVTENSHILRETFLKNRKVLEERVSRMDDEERKLFFSRGSSNENPNWKGYCKFINDDGQNFIFYSITEAKKITKINDNLIVSSIKTGKAIISGKWKGYKIFRSKEFI